MSRRGRVSVKIRVTERGVGRGLGVDVPCPRKKVANYNSRLQSGPNTKPYRFLIKASNIDRWSKFCHTQQLSSKFEIVIPGTVNIPPRHKRFGALPCEIQISVIETSNWITEICRPNWILIFHNIVHESFEIWYWYDLWWSRYCQFTVRCTGVWMSNEYEVMK